MAKDMKKINTSTNDEKDTKDTINIVETATTVEKENVKTESKPQEIDELKKQIEMLQALVLSQNANKINTTTDDGYIRADKSIQVMSLTPNLLNISTQGGGKGKNFAFRKFGDVKNIIYSDLTEILHNYYGFAEKGAFYIFDKEVVKKHGLESAYNEILDKKGIDTFLEKNVEDIKLIFGSLSEIQQESIVKNIVDKITAGEDVSTNKVNAIKEIYGSDIFQMAEEMKNWEEDVKELEEI